MQPDWISEAANRERWRDPEWGQWERIRDRMHDLGIEVIEPTQDRGGLYIGGREVVSLSEPLQHHEERPVLAALHRLEAKLGAHLHGTHGSEPSE